MTIGIDASRAVNEEAGIGRYTREVVRRLIEQGEDDQFKLLFTFVRDDGLTGQGRKKRWIDDIKSHRDNVQVKIVTMPGQLKEWLWGQRWWGIKKYLPNVEVIFAPSFFEAAAGEKTPQVVMIHDVSHALFPDQRGPEVSTRLTARTKVVGKIATKLITPSSAVRHDLIEHLGVEENKIIVIPEGYNTFFHELGNVERQPFFLFVGTISPRKNLVGLLEAFAQLSEDIRAEYTLKIVGATGWNTGPTYQTYEGLGLGDRVEFLGFKSDEELRLLYNQAAAFVFPSVSEGFGIPILEAMACGCPVVTSNISSMPEVAGEAALLVDPHQSSEIAAALTRLVSEPPLWAKFHRAGLERVKQFSWDETARRTLEILHEV